MNRFWIVLVILLAVSIPVKSEDPPLEHCAYVQGIASEIFYYEFMYIGSGAKVVIDLESIEETNTDAPPGYSNNLAYLMVISLLNQNPGYQVQGMMPYFSSIRIERSFPENSSDTLMVLGFINGKVNYGLSVCTSGKQPETTSSFDDNSTPTPEAINPGGASPISIYAPYDEAIHIYSIDPATSNGVITVILKPEEIEEAGIPTNAPLLLATEQNPISGVPIYVYRLPSGWFQINTSTADGKPYIFAWNYKSGESADLSYEQAPDF